MTVMRSEPIFAVRDVEQTVAFYRDVLGGSNVWLWGEPPSFAGIRLGQVQLMFNRQPELAAKVEGHEHHLFTETIDDLHAQHTAAEAPIVSPIENKPWGIREYTVRDPNGYHLRFSGPLGHEKPATALASLPAHIRIEPRLPTWDEYTALHHAVGWGRTKATPALLERCCAGCVAIDTRSDATVGMARAMHDAHAWYSVWDVVVHPDHQHQRVGSALMEAVIKRLREIGPGGSNVYLFTYQHGFYEKLGFKTQSCTMMRL